jgi:nitroreductase
MDTWNAIRARRNVRVYTDKRIPPPDLDRILDAGRRAPSSSNKQRWAFIVVTERARLEKLSHVWQGARHVADSAATVAIVSPRPATEYDLRSTEFDNGQAAMSMMLAAVELGIGSGHSAVIDQELARDILRFPPDHYCAWLIAFGYPADRPLQPIERPKRRPFEEVVHREHW